MFTAPFGFQRQAEDPAENNPTSDATWDENNANSELEFSLDALEITLNPSLE